MTTTCSPMHPAAQRTARVARSYWRCSDCGANHELDVPECIDCSTAEERALAPRRTVRARHWFVLVATWAAATATWAVASGFFTRGA